MMEQSSEGEVESPTPKKRSGILAGARAYLTKTMSDPALNDAASPQNGSRRSARTILSPTRIMSLSKIDERKSKKIPKEGSSSPPTSQDPLTPQAKQKIRRISSIEKSSKSVSTEGSSRGTRSTTGESDLAVSPSKRGKSKSTRSSSAGPLERKIRKKKSDDSKSVYSSSSRKSKSKSKKVRSSSAGPLLKTRDKIMSPKSTRGGHSSPEKSMPLEDLFDTEPPTPKTPKSSRKTVDSDGKIRRSPRKKSVSGDNSDDDGKSKVSMSSRSRRSSKGSSKSQGSRKVKDSTELKKKLKNSKSESNLAYSAGDDTSISSRRTKSSERQRLIERSERSERRISSRTGSDSMPAFPTFEDSLADIVESPRPKNTSELEEQIARLNKKIAEMTEENMKSQFAAQSEAAKLRKELREEKLELQRSQTERRELRAELRERDLMIDESDQQVQALEKAVESQMDKIEELVEELRRANADIFDLEQKLEDMERVLAESSAIETTNMEKEKDFGEKRSERMVRRLEEREKAVEERELKVRQDLEALRTKAKPDREIEQLEEDNRVLLKTMSKQRAEAAEILEKKEDNIKQLQKELKLAQMKSYSKLEGTGDERLAKLLEENVELQRRLDHEMDKASASLKEKDKLISSLQGNSTLGQNGSSSKLLGNSNDSEESLTADLLVLQSKLDGSTRRNQQLEDDIDHWKSINCGLEDELTNLKSQVAHWRSKYEEVEEAASVTSGHSGLSRPFSRQNSLNPRGETSVASMALGRRDDDDDDDDRSHMSAISEPATKIANLWSKLTTPQRAQKTLDSQSVNEVLARTTFH